MNKDPFFNSNTTFTEAETLEALESYRKVAKCSPNDIAYVFHLALTERDISLENCHRIAQRLRNQETARLNNLRSRVKDKNGVNKYKGSYYEASEESIDYLHTKDLGNYRNGTLLPKTDPTHSPDSPTLSESDQIWLELRRLKKIGGTKYYKKLGTIYKLYKDKSEIALEYKTDRTQVTNEFMELRNIHKL